MQGNIEFSLKVILPKHVAGNENPGIIIALLQSKNGNMIHPLPCSLLSEHLTSPKSEKTLNHEILLPGILCHLCCSVGGSEKGDIVFAVIHREELDTRSIPAATMGHAF